jgi:hypothetical protein
LAPSFLSKFLKFPAARLRLLPATPPAADGLSVPESALHRAQFHLKATFLAICRLDTLVSVKMSTA